MGIAQFERSLRAQPVGSLTLDYADPLAAATLFVQCGGQFVGAAGSGIMGPVAGSPVLDVGPGGRAIRLGGGLQRMDGALVPPVAGSQPFSIEVLCSITAAPSLAGFFGFYRFGGTVAGQARGLIAFGGGSNRSIYFWGGSADLASGVDWRIDGSMQHVIVTSRGSGTPMRFYRDGMLVASGTTPTLSATNNMERVAVGDTDSTWNSTPTGFIYKSAFYARELTAKDVLDLYIEPWRPFRRKRYYWEASTSALPNLTALSRIDSARRQDRYFWKP